MIIFASFLTAWLVGITSMPVMAHWAFRLGLIDLPDARKTHVGAVPRVGGLGITLGIVVALLIWCPLDTSFVAVLLGGVLLAGFGVWDDAKSLSPKIKLLGQTLAALIAVLGGGVVIRVLPLGAMIDLPTVVAVPFTVFVLVGITNAINLLDGLDGLAGGVSLLCAVSLALLAADSGSSNLFIASVAMIGAVLGFLRYNTYPAQIFMGDCGSQFLGYMVACLAILLTQTQEAVLSRSLPILLLGLPVLDTLTVMIRRIAAGNSPFSPDRTHIHHRLLSLGLSHAGSVTILYGLQTVLVFLAFGLRYSPDSTIIAVYLSVAATVVFLLESSVGSTVAAQSLAPINRGVTALATGEPNTGLAHCKAEEVRTWANLPLALVMAVYLLMAGLVSPRIPNDLGWVVTTLLVSWVAIYGWQYRDSLGLISRLVGYLSFAAAAYLFYTDAELPVALEVWGVIFFLLLVIGLAIAFVFHDSENFRVTPLDLLVIALVVGTNIFGFFSQPMGYVISQSILLYYGYEWVQSSHRESKLVNTSILLFMLIIIGRWLLQ